MIGTSDAYTGIGRNSRKTAALINADHTGSVALSTWVNEIAPRPNEMTPPTCVPASSTPDGASSLIDFHESRGVLRSPVDQRRNTYGKPKKSSHVAAVHGIGNAVSTSLLPMLYAVFKKYHAKKSTPRRTVRLRSERSSGSSMQNSDDFGSYGSHVPGSRPSDSAALPASAAPAAISSNLSVESRNERRGPIVDAR